MITQTRATKNVLGGSGAPSPRPKTSSAFPPEHWPCLHEIDAPIGPGDPVIWGFFP